MFFKRLAVVFCGHPRSFLDPEIRRNVLRLGVGPLCADATCDLFVLVSRTDASLFDETAPSRVRARNVTAAEIRGMLKGYRATVRDVENPPPTPARAADCPYPRPASALGYELANAAAAFAMVRESDGTYDAIVRMRFDAVWVRPAPSLAALLGTTTNEVIVPRHHFPVNNHFAVVPFDLAEAYFEGPLALWASCDVAWAPGKMLDNPEGLLLKSLLDRNVAIRRIDLYLTIYRPGTGGGAECVRLRAYGGTVAAECACGFPSVDPAKHRSNLREDAGFFYTFDNVYGDAGNKLQIAVSEATYRDDVRRACAGLDPPDPCLEHETALARAFEVLAASRARRNILWDDSFISSSKFAGFAIDTLDQWNAWVRDPHRFFRVNIDELETELDSSDEKEDDCCAPLEETVVVDASVFQLRFTPTNATIDTQIHALCAASDLDDANCAFLLSRARDRWRRERRDCPPPAGDPDASWPPPLQEQEEEEEEEEEEHTHDDGGAPAPSFRAPAPLDWLEEAARRRPAPPSKTMEPPAWTPPARGLAAKLADEVTAPWRGRGVTRDEVERAEASSPDCVLLQVIDGAVRVRASAEKRAAWNASSLSRPWRARRRRAAVELVASVATAIGRDLEVAFCPTDCVVGSTGTFYRHHDAHVHAVPALTLVGCAGSHNIPFPVFGNVRGGDLNESVANWDRLATSTLAPNRDRYPPWVDRDPRAIFRGQTKGQSCWRRRNDEGVGPQVASLDPACGRRRLRVVASRRPDRFDVDYDHVPLLAQERYRYQIYAEGHCGWSDRLRYLLFLNVGLFFQETFCREFFALGLRPWVHYVPLDYHFDNLAAAHSWAQEHPREMQRIVANMNAYAEAILSAAAIRAYAVAVLTDLAIALSYTPRPRDATLAVQDYLNLVDK
ncbi:hypothetical protein CTAYLR_009896 [Chrysophaeum taylorii]|uniref:Glycosyl transferase CAP10 domain-containing protein n=1 Tax=Chrysophaeum taylorii TaxID=2483200 RepID=A0AAD7UHR5_9STRA|nr:hypothetical protein CTAYLR_009896 [Chrysophaeum taylorii]